MAYARGGSPSPFQKGTEAPSLLGHQSTRQSCKTAPPHCLPKEPVPTLSYTAKSFDSTGTEYLITCEHAVVVTTRLSVIEFLAVDDMADEFSVVFTVRFEWVDPLLKGFKSEVAYYAADGSVRRRNAQVIHRPGMGGHVDFLLKVNPSLDFAVGDSVKADTDIDCHGFTIQSGTRGKVEGIDNKRGVLTVVWERCSKNSGGCAWTAVGPEMFAKVVLVSGKGCEIVGNQIRIPPSRFLWMQQPDWDCDKSLFQPKWSFLNAVDVPLRLAHDLKLNYVSEHGGRVFETFKFRGKFFRKLDMGMFPFDHQRLGIKLTSEAPMERQQLKIPNTDGGTPSIHPSEWKLDGPCKVSCKNASKSTGITLYTGIRVIVHVRRNPSFFLKNVVLLMFCLCCTSSLAVLVAPEKVGERAGILLTVLLVTAGYRHMISQWVPRRPYHTLLDYYTLVGFFLQFLVLIETLVLVLFFCESIDDADGVLDEKYNSEATGYFHRAPPDKECEEWVAEVDKLFFLILFGLWVLAHTLTALYYMCKACRRCWARLCSSRNQADQEFGAA